MVESSSRRFILYTPHGIWIRQPNMIELSALWHSSVTDSPAFFPIPPHPRGFTHLLHIFSAPSKSLMLSSQLKCFMLDYASPMATCVGSIHRLWVFPSICTQSENRGEQREERRGSTRTMANAYSFHWGVTLGTASVAHIVANGLTNQLRDMTHTCHFSFRCRWRGHTWEKVKRARAAPHHELWATLAICRSH